MEQINVYEGEQVISRILVEDGIEGLEACLEQYRHVFVIMDSNVAIACPAAYEMSQMLNRRGVTGMLVEVSEEAKCMDTVMNICGQLQIWKPLHSSHGIPMIVRLLWKQQQML